MTAARRCKMAFAAAFALACAACLPASAQDAPLFKPSGATISVQGVDPTDPGLARHRMASLDANAFAAQISTLLDGTRRLPARTTLNLFEDRALAVVLTDASLDAAADAPRGILNGYVDGVDFSIVTLHIDGAAITGIIWAGDRHYRVIPIDPPRHRIEEVDPNRLPGRELRD